MKVERKLEIKKYLFTGEEKEKIGKDQDNEYKNGRDD